MSAMKIIQALGRKIAAKKARTPEGITQIQPQIYAEAEAGSIAQTLVDSGLPMNKFDEFIKSEKDLLKYLNIIESVNKPRIRVIDADSLEGKGITESLLGKKGKVIEADFGKPISEEMKNVQKRIDSGVAAAVEKILGMKPIDAMKEANSVIGRKGVYKNLSPEDAKKILQDTEDHIFERNIDIDPEDFAEGGVAGMLGERQNFKMGRRAFLKMLAGTGAGIAGLKTGVTGLGGKKVATEVAKEAVTTSGGTPPPYFFNLVKKIKNLGDDVTSKSATTERQKVTKYKDYELTEDLTTGEQTIQKKSFADPDEGFTYENKTEEVYMNYKPGKGQADEATGKVADEYVEDTSYVGTSGGNKGEIVDTVDGVPDEVIQEGTVFEDDITDFTTKKLRKKKAGGGVAYMLGQ